MSTRPRTLFVAAACTLAGAGGAFAVGALNSAAHDGGHHHGQFRFAHRGFGPRFGDGLFRAVHATAVVPTSSGDFATVTFDRGTVKDVSGQDLTLTEGTTTNVYKDETITVPSDARVRVFGVDNATLADVKPGMRAAVIQAPRKTFVRAGPGRRSATR